MKGCFFIGHREAPPEIFPELVKTVARHVEEYGVHWFVVGHYGNFDRLAARAVILSKECHPEIKLSLLLPYHPTERPVEVPLGFDDLYYPMGMETVPRRLAILRANQAMIDRADFLIAYAWHPASNARKLVEYAEKRRRRGELQITCIEPLMREHE